VHCLHLDRPKPDAYIFLNISHFFNFSLDKFSLDYLTNGNIRAQNEKGGFDRFVVALMTAGGGVRYGYDEHSGKVRLFLPCRQLRLCRRGG
jgi:hypothetical protein